MKLRRAVNCWIALLLVVALITPLWPPPVLAQADAPPSTHGVVTIQADFRLNQADTAEFKSLATLAILVVSGGWQHLFHTFEFLFA